MIKTLIVICCLVGLSGCSALSDMPASVAGVSVRALEDARVDAIYQSYPCTINDCFDAVIKMAGEREYYIFTEDRIRGLVILMKIPGCVDTTEVGVFVSESLHGEGVLVELSSRSLLAKKTVAKALFTALAARFNKV